MNGMILWDLKTGQIILVDVEKEFGFDKEEELIEFLGEEIKKKILELAD